ncbi:MAG: late competence development ComFB family protein [Cyanobacteriota bacterium]|nr:late competence development ComFB family protein [Cyanobacteriota bacterium]
MGIQHLNQALTHLNHSTINVMQILVLQEVDRQLKELSHHQTQYIKPVEVVTYALNRLPPLYASSQEGLGHQLKQAQSKYKPQITVAVRQGIAAVQRDPLRRSTPLALRKQNQSQPPLKPVHPEDPKAPPNEASQELSHEHWIYSHAEYCQMAKHLATFKF